MRKLRILLAEDHATVREGLKMIIDVQADMQVVGEADNGQAAVERAQALLPDVVVMDVSLPLMNGRQATETLRHCCPQVKILTLTRHAEAGYLQDLLRAGASGYVLKQSESAELLRAIRAVASGGHYIDPAIAGEVVRDYGRRKAAGPPEPGGEALSSREEEVMRLLAIGHSNKEIASRLGVSVKTVETHRSNAMQKLGLRSRIDIVRFAILRRWLDDV